MDTIRVLSALLTPVIALTTVTILILQYRLQRYKVRHELYEPRMKVYRSVRDFLQYVLQYGDASSEQLAKLMEETSEAQFLFKGKIKQHIRELYSHAVDIQTATKGLKSQFPHSEEFLDKVENKHETEFKWFMNQIDKLDELFSEYLTLDI